MTEQPPPSGTCTSTGNYATGERCGSTEIAGFVLHVTPRNVTAALTGDYPDLYLQPHCAEHLKQTDESNLRLREHGPSPLLVDIGFVGAAVGTVWIIQPPVGDEEPHTYPCPTCGGNGCASCGGTGERLDS